MQESNDIQVWRDQVAKAATAASFEASDMGSLVIGWLNHEIMRLTAQLVDDDALDTDQVKRAAVRAELKAYRLIGEKLNLTKVKGEGAKRTLAANNINPEHLDERSPEEIARAAGL